MRCINSQIYFWNRTHTYFGQIFCPLSGV